MNKKRSILFLLLLSCFGLGESCKVKERGSSSYSTQKYNVLFIAIDDLRPELGCYGQAIYSPNIDKLAAQGMVFNRAYCQEAICSPSRTSMLTGLRPDETKVYGLTEHFRQTVPDVVTLPQLFKNNGYQAISLGKIFHSGLDDSLSWHYSEHGAYLPWLSEENLYLAKNSPERRGKAYEIADAPDSAYFDGQVALKAVRYLNQVKDDPFFLAVGFIKPHLPFSAPRKYWDFYNREEIHQPEANTVPLNSPAIAHNDWGELRNYHGIPKEGPLNDSLARTLIHGYKATVSYVDAQVGLVLDELERLGLEKNTIVVVWGDHGWKLGEYGKWCKHTNYELDTRSPLVVYAPGMNAGGGKTDALVELVDIYPTLADLTGLPVPEHVQGTSFSPLLQDPERDWKKAVFSQYPKGEVMGYAMRTEGYRLVRWQQRQQPGKIHALELYDHHKDPQEMKNVAGLSEYQGILKELNQIMDKGWKEANDFGP